MEMLGLRLRAMGYVRARVRLSLLPPTHYVSPIVSIINDDDSSRDDAMMNVTVENVSHNDWVSPACRPCRRINLPRIQRLYFSYPRKAGVRRRTDACLLWPNRTVGPWLWMDEGKAAEAPLRNDTLCDKFSCSRRSHPKFVQVRRSMGLQTISKKFVLCTNCLPYMTLRRCGP